MGIGEITLHTFNCIGEITLHAGMCLDDVLRMVRETVARKQEEIVWEADV